MRQRSGGCAIIALRSRRWKQLLAGLDGSKVAGGNEGVFACCQPKYCANL
jgi:hypothetical protein